MRRLKIDDRKNDGCHCREYLKEKQASGLADVVRRRIEGGSGVEIGMLGAAEQVRASTARWASAVDPRWFGLRD